MNEWIDARTKSPPKKNEWNSCWWLVHCKGQIPRRALFINGNWQYEVGNLIYDVSHWMPLPSLPKQEIESE